MTTEADPIAGDWYHRPDKNLDFFVVDVDEAGEILEIQYFDGTIEEMPMDDWWALNVEPTAPPEDWTGPLDDMTRSDLEEED